MSSERTPGETKHGVATRLLRAVFPNDSDQELHKRIMRGGGAAAVIAAFAVLAKVGL